MSAHARVLLNRLLAKARFRHLQVLVKLAEVGSVRRTAEAIGMTQPGVTQLLADLEALLDVPLFHRHARGVLPTAACLDLLPLARQSHQVNHLRLWRQSAQLNQPDLSVRPSRRVHQHH